MKFIRLLSTNLQTDIYHTSLQVILFRDWQSALPDFNCCNVLGEERHWRLLTLYQNLFHEVFFHEHCRCEIQTLNQKCMFVTTEFSAIMSEGHVSHTERCTLLSQNFQKWKDHAVNQQACIYFSLWNTMPHISSRNSHKISDDGNLCIWLVQLH